MREEELERTVLGEVNGEENSTPFLPEDNITLTTNIEFLEMVGGGGMGEVWKVKSLGQGEEKIIAVKVQKPRSGLLERMKKEVELGIKLDHIGIAGIHGFSVQERYGEKYGLILMEYVEGAPLSKIIKDHDLMGLHYPVKLGGLFGWFMCSALQYAHKEGIVHRDIKPSNIIMGKDGNPKLIDFGLATSSSINQKREHISGSIYYMSPEQTQSGDDIDLRTDIFSLGMTLYELISGENPIEANSQRSNELDYIFRIQHEMPRIPLGNLPGIDRKIRRIIGNAIRPNRDERYQTTREMASALENYVFTPQSIPEKAQAIRDILKGTTAIGPTRDATRLYLEMINSKEMRSHLDQLRNGENPQLPSSIRDMVEYAKPRMRYMIRRGKFCLETTPGAYPQSRKGYLPLA